MTDLPPQLTPEEILWVRKTREGQRAISLVLGWLSQTGIWVAAVVGGLVAVLNWHPWSKGG